MTHLGNRPGYTLAGGRFDAAARNRPSLPKVGFRPVAVAALALIGAGSLGLRKVLVVEVGTVGLLGADAWFGADPPVWS